MKKLINKSKIDNLSVEKFRCVCFSSCRDCDPWAAGINPSSIVNWRNMRTSDAASAVSGLTITEE